MTYALDRLKESKQEYSNAQLKRSQEERAKRIAERAPAKRNGTEWAQQHAEYAELKRLSVWPRVRHFSGKSLSLAVVVEMIWPNENVDQDRIDKLWDRNSSDNEADKDSHQYWDAFIEGAAEVFTQLEKE